MRFRSSARLDASQVSDRRGAGLGIPVAAGGGLIGLVVLVLQVLSGGGGSGLGLDLGQGQGAASDLSSECRTGADANQRDDCRIVGVVNSVQSFWSERLQGYREASTVFFSQATTTGCGNATSQVGPFYCPLDATIYIDLGFYDDLRTRFGASGGPLAEAYVIAHEYGHHVENLLGVLDQAERGDAGVGSDSVKVEIMADCLAGMWAKGAVDTGYIEEISEADIRDGLDAAAAVGDDRIQERVQGRVDPESWTHGSSEQRQEAFLTGYRSGRLQDCNQF
ncbi:MAG TPA: neutral zinc metallopeptidase [Acidimicrobiales bacterium]|nr:neutral zinc metallopeptidase [Acidimicrobiales bacterium]